MKCTKCNREYPNERPVCPYCHTPNDNVEPSPYVNIQNIQNNQTDSTNPVDQTNQVIQTTSIDQADLEKRMAFNNNMINSNYGNINDRYIAAFIGNGVDSYKKGGISFSYLFLGEYYLLYRKMYLLFFMKYAATVLLLIATVGCAVSNNSQGILMCILGYFIIQLGPIFFVKRYYMHHVESSIKKIIENNKDKSESEIIKICSQKGGTDLIIPVAIIVLSSMITTRINNMTLMKTRDVTVKDLHVKATNYLKLNDEYYDGFSIDKRNECYVSVKVERSDDDSEINDKSISGLVDKKINNHTWRYTNYDGTDYYYTSYKDYNYMITTKNINNKYCKKTIEILVNSMNFD